MSKIKALIFDFDGVIVESVDIKANAFAHLFRDYPDQVDRIVEFHLTHGGMSRFDKFEWIYREMLGQPLSAEKKEALGREFSDYAYQQVLACPFVRGAKEFLESFHKEYSCFVVSGTPQDEIRLIVQERGLTKYFLGVYGSPRKKAELNAGILREYKFQPEEAAVIGDSLEDYNGAQQAKTRFIGRRDESNSALSKIKPDAWIADLTELKGALDAL